MIKINRVALAALAVLGTTTAMAQSSVTLYGRVNTSVEHQKVGGQGVTGMFNNASRFGFRGVEDLGGGLKAGFALESGFNSDTGTGSGWTHPTAGMSFGRQSEVNLGGAFGTVRLGNFVPESYYATADYVSMHNHDTGSSSDAFYQDPVWFGGLSTKNKIGYASPNLGGLTLHGSMSMHEKDRTLNYEKHGYDLAANYAAGPVQLGAGYSTVGADWQAALRAAYTFGQFTVGGYYQRSHQKSLRLGWMDGNRNNFRLSGMYALGASEFHVNVGKAGKWSEVADSSALQWTLGYNYNFSKRTKVYAYYTKVDNKAGARYMTGTAGDDFSSFALGVRHNF